MLADSLVIDPRKARIHRLRSSIREACKLHEQEAEWASHRLGRSAYRKTFITLTYRDGGDWKRRHISDFLKQLRRWMKAHDAGLLYAWVAETQKRGALHYHMLVWVPRRLRLPRPDASGWWPHGMSNIETARNPVGYMVKYATKTTPDDLKRLKKGVRLHGNGGHSPVNRVALRETLAPWWVRQLREARETAALVAHVEADQAWEARRVRVEWTAADGSRRWRYDDPDGPPYESEAWWQAWIDHEERRAAEEAQWVAYADRYYAKGCPKYQRVPGGFVDLLTGELLPTPWRVTVGRGVVTAHRVPETLQ
jgi:hypothetical protein